VTLSVTIVELINVTIGQQSVGKRGQLISSFVPPFQLYSNKCNSTAPDIGTFSGEKSRLSHTACAQSIEISTIKNA